MHRGLLLLVLVLFSAACRTAVPTPTPLPPTPTPVVTGSPAVTGPERELVASWVQAWSTVKRFRAEIMVYDGSGALQQRLQLAVVLPDRLHAVQLDPATGQAQQEWIIVGDAGWIRQGENWQLGRIQQPLQLADLYDPGALMEARESSAGSATVEFQQLPSETVDGVACETWQITVTPAGQPANRITLWIGEGDDLPRQLRTEYPDGSALVLRYGGYDETFDIQPPKEG